MNVINKPKDKTWLCYSIRTVTATQTLYLEKLKEKNLTLVPNLSLKHESICNKNSNKATPNFLACFTLFFWLKLKVKKLNPHLATKNTGLFLCPVSPFPRNAKTTWLFLVPSSPSP